MKFSSAAFSIALYTLSSLSLVQPRPADPNGTVESRDPRYVLSTTFSAVNQPSIPSFSPSNTWPPTPFGLTLPANTWLSITSSGRILSSGGTMSLSVLLTKTIASWSLKWAIVPSFNPCKNEISATRDIIAVWLTCYDPRSDVPRLLLVMARLLALIWQYGGEEAEMDFGKCDAELGTLSAVLVGDTTLA